MAAYGSARPIERETTVRCCRGPARGDGDDGTDAANGPDGSPLLPEAADAFRCFRAPATMTMDRDGGTVFVFNYLTVTVRRDCFRLRTSASLRPFPSSVFRKPFRFSDRKLFADVSFPRS